MDIRPFGERILPLSPANQLSDSPVKAERLRITLKPLHDDIEIENLFEDLHSLRSRCALGTTCCLTKRAILRGRLAAPFVKSNDRSDGEKNVDRQRRAPKKPGGQSD